MKSIYIKERLDMSNLSKRIKASIVLLAFAAYMPVSLLPSMAAPGADTIAPNTAPELDKSINGGYVGWNGTDKNKFDVNLSENLGQNGVAQFDWKTFNVGKDVTVDWIFTNHSQTAINRVLNSGGMSKIYGKLTSSCTYGDCGAASTAGSGKVILINPNGILFGQGSQVNINSFTASTADIKGMKDITKALEDGDYGISKDNVNSYGSYVSGASKAVTRVDANGNPILWQGNPIVDYVQEGGISDKFSWKQAITFDKNGNGIIELDGSTFNGPGTDAKTVALISDKVKITDSDIRTYVSEGTEGNVAYEGRANSNVRIITSDGVTLDYSNYGNIVDSDKYKINSKPDKVEGKDYGIEIKNSTIQSGLVDMVNAFEDANLVIDGSTVVANKLWNGPLGQIVLESTGDIVIKDSQVETFSSFGSDVNNTTAKYNQHGNIDITAVNNVFIDNSRIQSAYSDKNIGLDKAVAGNINIVAENGNVEITKSKTEHPTIPEGYVNIVSGGNLNISAQRGDVIVDLNGSKIQAAGYDNGDLIIRGGDVEIANTLLGANNVGIYSGSIDGAGNLIGSGALIVDKSGINATNALDLIGFNTVLTDANLSYNNIKFYNQYMDNNGLLNNVEIKDATTFYSRTTDADGNLVVKGLDLETNGALIVDNNKLQRKGVSEVAPDSEQNKLQNQKGDIKLTSTKSFVSIRNNSNIETEGSIEANAATSVAVGASTLKAGKDITLEASEVTIGDMWSKGEKTPEGYDITYIGEASNILAGRNNTINAKAGDVYVRSSNIIAGNNNDIDATGSVTITKTNSKDYGSTVKAGNESDIDAGTYVWVNKSEVSAKNDNRITANGTQPGDYVEISNSTVKSDDENVTITQRLTMDLNNHFYNSTIDAKKNINLNVLGKGEDIVGESFEALAYGGKLNLQAANDIVLDSKNAWDINNVNFYAGHDTLITSSNDRIYLNNSNFTTKGNNTISAVGDILISSAVNLNEGRTTLTANGSVITDGNGVINAKGNKLIVNADKNIDIAFTGVNNKNLGLEINSNVDTSKDNGKSLEGRNVTLKSNDENATMALAKVKADTLTIVNPDKTAILAATDNKANAKTDNIDTTKAPKDYNNRAYIEVNQIAGWNMDNVDVDKKESLPGFYNPNTDKEYHWSLDQEAGAGFYKNHLITFDGNENFTLTYRRAGGDCLIPPPSSDFDYSALDESALVRLPKHEQGVSAVAPVLNNITDPTANVIMAAARLTLDDENETDEDKF